MSREPAVAKRLLAAKRSFGMLKFAQFDKDDPAVADLTTSQPENPIININELLPSNVLKLLNAAKTDLKEVGFKYVWCKNSMVLAKASDAAVPYGLFGGSVLYRIFNASARTFRNPVLSRRINNVFYVHLVSGAQEEVVASPSGTASPRYSRFAAERASGER